MKIFTCEDAMDTSIYNDNDNIDKSYSSDKFMSNMIDYAEMLGFEIKDVIDDIEDICDNEHTCDYSKTKAYLKYCSDNGYQPTLDHFNDSFEGKYDSIEDFTMQLEIEQGNIDVNSSLLRYVDWTTRYECDLIHEYDYVERGNSLYFFKSL